MSKKKMRRKTSSSAPPSRQGLKVHRFLGIALGGGKTDRTSLAMIEYFPKQNKIFLSRLFEKIHGQPDLSSDEVLLRLIDSSGDVEFLAFDVPLSWPICVGCKLICPGFEKCSEPELQWMWKHHRKKASQKKVHRLFTPYTERCVEQHFQTELEHNFQLGHALGANLAPLTARAHYLRKRLRDLSAVEVMPKASLYRMGRALGLARSHLLHYRHSVTGEESRRIILEKLISENVIFIYDQDKKGLIDNNQAFDALICAMTATLNFKGACEPRPRDFPKSAGWIALPKDPVQF